jgi:hypothetical protein
MAFTANGKDPSRTELRCLRSLQCFFNFWGNVSCQARKTCEWDFKGSRIFSYGIGFRKASNFAVKLALSCIFMSGGAQDTSV